MKNILTLLLLLTTYAGFSQYLVWTPETQSVSGASGNFITAKITVSCQGTEGQYASYSLSPCDDDGYFHSIDWQMGNVYVGSPVEITFKFKKPASTSTSSYTYTFKKDFGNCEDTDKVSITVNYGTASCDYDPQVFSASSSPNSITINWTKDPNITNYFLGIKKSTDTSWGVSNNILTSECDNPICSRTREGLLPSTTYNIRIRTVCANGLSGGYIYLNCTTQPCSQIGPTNLNATTWSGTGYYISFTPVVGTYDYGFEYVDLVNNNTGTGTIYYSSTPNEGNNTDTTIPLSHDFKFRLIVPCSGAASEWKTITAPLCDLQAPSNPALVNYCGYGSGGTCGYGRFTWAAVSGANRYEVEYILYNLNGQTITGTFQTASTTHVQPNMYTNGASNSWFAKFRVRSRCASNIWSTYGEYTTPTPW